jgi:hypothetical protein
MKGESGPRGFPGVPGQDGLPGKLKTLFSSQWKKYFVSQHFCYYFVIKNFLVPVTMSLLMIIYLRVCLVF